MIYSSISIMVLWIQEMSAQWYINIDYIHRFRNNYSLRNSFISKLSIFMQLDSSVTRPFSKGTRKKKSLVIRLRDRLVNLWKIRFAATADVDRPRISQVYYDFKSHTFQAIGQLALIHFKLELKGIEEKFVTWSRSWCRALFFVIQNSPQKFLIR